MRRCYERKRVPVVPSVQCRVLGPGFMCQLDLTALPPHVNELGTLPHGRCVHCGGELVMQDKVAECYEPLTMVEIIDTMIDEIITLRGQLDVERGESSGVSHINFEPHKNALLGYKK